MLSGLIAALLVMRAGYDLEMRRDKGSGEWWREVENGGRCMRASRHFLSVELGRRREN